MIRPAFYSARVLYRTGKLPLQNTRISKHIRWQSHHKAEYNVISSTRPDIEMPKCTLSEFVWRDMDLWPDKTAVVCIKKYKVNAILFIMLNL